MLYTSKQSSSRPKCHCTDIVGEQNNAVIYKKGLKNSLAENMGLLTDLVVDSIIRFLTDSLFNAAFDLTLLSL